MAAPKDRGVEGASGGLGVLDAHRGGSLGAPEGRPRAVHDEPLRGPGDDGGQGGLREGRQVAPGLSTRSASEILAPVAQREPPDKLV